MLIMINKLSIVNKKVIEVTTLAHKQILNIMEMNIASYSTTMHHYDLHKKFDNIEISILHNVIKVCISTYFMQGA